MAMLAERSLRPLDMDELENSVLFKGVDLQSVQGLLKESPLLELERLEVLIEAKQSNRFLYLLLKGRLSIRLKLTLDPMAIIGPGEFVGELAVLDGLPTSAYVIADTDCRLLALEEQGLWSLIHHCPTVARNLLFVVSKRLQKGNTLILSGLQLERAYTDFTVLDGLTGVYNRKWLEKMLPRTIERSQTDLSLLLIQINDLETYIEHHGHQAGGYALFTIARTIRTWLEGDENIIRYSNDRFIVILPGTNAYTAQRIATQLRYLISICDVVTLENDVYPPATISVGIALMSRQDTSATLIAAAESSLSDAIFQQLVTRMELEPMVRAEKRHQLNRNVKEVTVEDEDVTVNHEVAVLEVLKIFKKTMSVGKIANELVAIHWDFDNHHPRIVVHEALKTLLGEGVVEQVRGDFGAVQ
ncbi:MAG: diguanylate cyclase [Acidobacteriota bacterium]